MTSADAILLGAVHRRIGIHDQRFCGRAIGGKSADPNARGDVALRTVQDNRLGQFIEDPPRDRLDLSRIRGVVQNECEFIAADTADKIRFLHQSLEALPDHLE
jgi:hypothetical protein